MNVREVLEGIGYSVTSRMNKARKPTLYILEGHQEPIYSNTIRVSELPLSSVISTSQPVNEDEFVVVMGVSTNERVVYTITNYLNVYVVPNLVDSETVAKFLLSDLLYVVKNDAVRIEEKVRKAVEREINSFLIDRISPVLLRYGIKKKLLAFGNVTISVHTNLSEESIANVVNSAVEELKPRMKVIQKAVMRAKKLEQDVRSVEWRQGFIDGIRFWQEIIKQGWVVEGEYLVYPKRIYSEFIRKGGKLYKIPEEFQKKFYVEGVKVKLKPRIKEVWVAKHNHCNVGNDGFLCLGEISNMPIESVAELINLLKIQNLDSPYYNSAERLADQLIEEGKATPLDEDNDIPLFEL